MASTVALSLWTSSKLIQTRNAGNANPNIHSQTHKFSRVVLRTTEIENIEILADPPNAFKLLNPKNTDTEQPAAKLSDETNKSAAQPQQQHKVSPKNDDLFSAQEK